MAGGLQFFLQKPGTKAETRLRGLTLKLSLNCVDALRMTTVPFDRLRPSILPLCQLPAGALGRVQALEGEPAFCQRVREMGFGEKALVTKVSGTTTILCQVNGARIALSHDAARGILVEQLTGRR